ncbi:MAG TPA: hypothetical protein VFN56_02140 [Candidatus Saccharimonadales bacterium]|nr:hypothetical protein [Candidatus Saccharimonadales bacterium]
MSGKQIPFLVPVMVILLGTVMAALPSFEASAVETITNRALTLSSSSPNASNATTSYTFTFTVGNTTTVVKSIDISICDTADGTCTNTGGSLGFSNASATLSSQPTGLGAASGWSMRTSPPTAYDLDIVNATNATAPSGSQTIVFKNVQNPTTANKTFFARITTYSDSAYTTAVDNGVVAAATANPIVLTGTMPESLSFCTGQSIGLTSGIPDCTTATPGNISFNQDFSPSATAYATSQMAASTNAVSGYAITVSGATLTSGANTIPAMTTTGTSTVGTGQFGLNLVQDTAANAATPAPSPASASVTPTGGSFQKGEALTGYNTGGSATTAQYTYNPAGLNNVADSTNSATDPQIFTTTYIVNVAGHQGAGTYTTTLTYICTPTF